MRTHPFFALIAAALCLPCMALAEPGGDGEARQAELVEYVEDTRQNSLEQLFTYAVLPEGAEEPLGKAPEDIELVVPGENEAYRAGLLKHVRARHESAGQGAVRIRALRSISVNTLTALEWSVENVSDAPILLTGGGMSVNGTCGAVSRAVNSDRILMPGEIMLCVAADQQPWLTGDAVSATVMYDVYSVAEGALPEDTGEEFFPEEGDAQLMGKAELAIELERSIVPALSALKSGEVIEREWRGSTLRVTQAWQSLSAGAYTVQRIFDTREQALANSPFADDWWDARPYCAPDEGGGDWIMIGGGSGDDEPVMLEDGRWAYSVTHTADMLNYLPGSKVYIVPVTRDGEDYQSAIELELTMEIPQPAMERE
ncbi:MAG: hypothetical protein ACOYIH_00570 [Candidatus Fimadaptatus sp.]|jgi:hypothetical protein